MNDYERDTNEYNMGDNYFSSDTLLNYSFKWDKRQIAR